MIFGFIGKMGSGKTLSMTYMAEKFRTESRIKHIYANYGYKNRTETITFNLLKNMSDDVEDGLLLLDEMHIFMDSRESMKKKNRIISYFITQSRKRNIILMYTTQTWGQVDKRLRMNTDYLISCEKVMKNNEHYVKCILQDVDMKERKFFIRARPMYALYDTKEIIDFTEE